MSHVYCDANIRLFTVQLNARDSAALSPQKFAFMKGNIQRSLFEMEGFGRLIHEWSTLTVPVDARTLEIRGLKTPSVRGDEHGILADAVTQLNAALGSSSLDLAPPNGIVPPRPVCKIVGPVPTATSRCAC
ncbi:MAG: hypothetical protein E2O39_01945 [Planctomycetota bacterium]|nr:MAG: hypothetical protein E2O39_01945 [Planctomycetota bacterium]